MNISKLKYKCYVKYDTIAFKEAIEEVAKPLNEKHNELNAKVEDLQTKLEKAQETIDKLGSLGLSSQMVTMPDVPKYYSRLS